MTTESKTKIFSSGHRRTIYLPKEIWNDSQFPFSTEDNLKIKIKDRKIIIEKE